MSEFIESGNYRIGKLFSKTALLVKSNSDGILLKITKFDKNLKKDTNNLKVNDICQIYRTTKDTCILIDWKENGSD